MKLKLDTHSIKFKVCLYFIIFAVLLMGVLWILQVLFLNVFYHTMKESKTVKTAQEIKSAYADNTLPAFTKKVNEIAESSDMDIYITDMEGKPFLTVERDNSSRDYTQEMLQVHQKMDSSHKDFMTMSIRKERPVRRTLACGMALTDTKEPDKPDMVAYVFSPLYPVKSTIEILTNQLIYITIISLALALIIAFYLATRITTPIRNITSAASRLESGEYGIVFKGGAYSELNKLADTLTQASINLEKSSVLQKDLIANVSHDLRTPLTMIRSYAEMIRDLSGDNPEKRNAHLQVIIEESDRLNLLVGDMLTLSRIQSGAIAIEKTVFDLYEAVESVLLTYKLIMEESGYRINFSCPRPLMVCADRERIKQVFSNLINNALKFCGPDKTVNVTISEKGRHVLCRVQDHGVGIPADELDHIWERYYKASSNMVRPPAGSGLGLSIVKEILYLHKTDYGVESTVGEGTTFWFELNRDENFRRLGSATV